MIGDYEKKKIFVVSYASICLSTSQLIDFFQVDDNGDYHDGMYREHTSTVSGLYGRMIGRTAIERSSKKEFSVSDICREGYLFKRGSWFKSWYVRQLHSIHHKQARFVISPLTVNRKKRYFILRKDTHSLCYFPSKESTSLQLLGTVKLSQDSNVRNVRPEDAGAIELLYIFCFILHTY